MKILNLKMTKKYYYPLLSDAFNSKDINEGIKVLKTRFITMSKITEKFENYFAKHIFEKYFSKNNFEKCFLTHIFQTSFLKNMFLSIIEKYF